VPNNYQTTWQNAKQMSLRIAGYKKLNSPRYYMVTFDLKGSDGRKSIYNRFTRHLNKFLGKDNVNRIIKQCYFIKSDYGARDVRTEMQGLLSDSDSILVARLQPGRSYSLKTPGAGKAARAFFDTLKADESRK